jgi:hypothetical protein
MGKRAPGSDSAGPKNKLPGQITYGSWQLSFVLNFFFPKNCDCRCLDDWPGYPMRRRPRFGAFARYLGLLFIHLGINILAAGYGK